MPYRIRYRNNRDMAVCFMQISKLGNVGKLYGNVGKLLTLSNLFQHNDSYTFKAQAGRVLAMLSPNPDRDMDIGDPQSGM